MNAQNEKCPAPEQASEAVPQRPKTENPTAEAIFEQAAGAGHLISSKFGFGDGNNRADALTDDPCDSIKYAIQVPRRVEAGDGTFVGQCADAITGLETILAASPVEQPAAAPLARKTSNPHRGGTQAYLATEHFNEGWNSCLDEIGAYQECIVTPSKPAAAPADELAAFRDALALVGRGEGESSAELATIWSAGVAFTVQRAANMTCEDGALRAAATFLGDDHKRDSLRAITVDGRPMTRADLAQRLLDMIEHARPHDGNSVTLDRRDLFDFARGAIKSVLEDCEAGKGMTASWYFQEATNRAEALVEALDTRTPYIGETPADERATRARANGIVNLTQYAFELVGAIECMPDSPQRAAVLARVKALRHDLVAATSESLFGDDAAPAMAAEALAIPAGWQLVPKRITAAMIESAMEHHYGKRRARQNGGAAGIVMTVDDLDWSGIDAMRRFWKGALAAAPQPPAQADAREALTDERYEAILTAAEDVLEYRKRVYAAGTNTEALARQAEKTLRFLLAAHPGQAGPRAEVANDEVVSACEAHGIALPVEALGAATALVNLFAARAGERQ
ncbi:hypothetical protein WK94_01950 [Burkholderia ubonensis]|uniref:hypothetical protein n=1 Tax=Burkholderia ubonensis TaxID=101571 RepID=UPI00075C93CF|nr:hypothetical protein [Burkholderia ubonensis]KVW25856.1 hypothetical protein WK94_01950 [Burkholderia ubonensis]